MNTVASVVPLTVEHWPQIERIYAAGIATGHATFEVAPTDWPTFDAANCPTNAWSSPQRRLGSGPSRQASSPRTWPVCTYTKRLGSRSSASGADSAR